VGRCTARKKIDFFSKCIFLSEKSILFLDGHLATNELVATQLATNFCPHVCLRLPFAMLVSTIFAATFASEVFLPWLLELFLPAF